MRASKLPARDAITRPPVTAEPDITIDNAARIMRAAGVGSLIVVDKGKIAGILTEGDVLKKVVAKNLLPSRVKVKDIMNRPVVCIDPDMDIVEAAKRMAKLKIRRLPVIENNQLIGMVTEKDIIRLSPVLIDITREYAMINRGSEEYAGESMLKGKCEDCSAYSTDLRDVDGRLLCERCRKV